VRLRLLLLRLRWLLLLCTWLASRMHLLLRHKRLRARLVHLLRQCVRLRLHGWLCTWLVSLS
jgi:hypothetical protein